MGFLNPILLFGAAAIAVPIAIHLLNKRQYEKVTWAAMRFLMASVEQNQRRLRIEDLLLLILRCALLVLLALALARPAIPGGGAGGLFGRSGVTAALVLDNSYSMGMSDGVTTRFDNAKRALEQVLDSLPTNSSASVLLAGDGVEAVIAEPTLDLNLARKTIREAKLSDRASNVVPALRTAVEGLKNKPSVRREMYFATDGQAVGWRQFESATRTLAESKDAVASHVLLVGPKGDQNLAVTDLRLASGLPVVDRSLRFEARVSNSGLTDANNVRVRLSVNGEAPNDGATIDSLPAGESKSVSLFAKLREPGSASVTASIEADRLPADDSRTIAVRATDQISVLLVSGNAASGRDADTFFLQNALAPAGAEAGDHFIKATPVNATDVGSVRFDNFDAVVLANVADLSTGPLDALVEYVRGGGGLVIFPGPATESTAKLFYNEALYANRAMLPAMLGSATGDAKADEKATPLQSQNFDHPIASIWNDPASGSLADVKVRRHFPLQAGAYEAEGAVRPEGSGVARTVLRLADGSPLMMERTFGAGRVVLFGTTASTLWTDLPVRPGVFVPLVYRTLASLVGRQDDALNVPVGAPFAYRSPLDWVNRDATVLPPDTDPNATRLTTRVELVNNAPLLRVTETPRSGPYEIQVATDPASTLKFAAQPDPAESNLTEMPPDQEKSLGEATMVIRVNNGTPLEQMVQKSRVGTELWLPLAMIALLIAASETFLAQWFGRSR
ncbi:MAG TPA: BatA domain-containing protein [Tepidisphaeraceae bacterium]|jgi:hypothetical protein|nr:BatA domain-containing protein [Tepidisphaeraceae bacterium]